MTGPANWHDELQTLCEAVIEERLTDAQRQRLEQLVLARPEARRFYVEYLHQHGSLHWSGGSAECGVRSAELQGTGKRGRRLWLGTGLLAASVLVALGVWLLVRPAAAPAVATLVGAKACKWDAASLPTEPGARLAAGRLRLAEGLARITFDSGAEVTLEAPADLELVSAQRCVLHSGRLVANVPAQAIGFVIDTPTAVLKDLGTEFGVHVKDGATSDVQVFNGIVDVQHRGSGKTERLLTGNNRRFGTTDVIDFDPLAEKPAGPDVRADGSRVIQISTAMGRGKDAYIQPLFPAKGHSDILLLVKNTMTEKSDYVRKACIGLDLAPVRGREIRDAQLNFTFTPTGLGFATEVPDATFTVWGLTDETLDGWDEDTIRWANAPANLPGGAELDQTKATKLGTFEIVQGVLSGTRSIAGPALAAFLNRDTNGLATFILVRDTRGSGRSDLVHGFANKHHPNLPPPTLKLTVGGK